MSALLKGTLTLDVEGFRVSVARQRDHKSVIFFKLPLPQILTCIQLFRLSEEDNGMRLNESTVPRSVLSHKLFLLYHDRAVTMSGRV